MSIWEIIGGVLLLISGILLVVIVLMQEGKENGLSGAIQGGSQESYLNTNSGSRTRDAKLKKATKFIAIFFFVLTVLANVAAAFLSNPS